MSVPSAFYPYFIWRVAGFPVEELSAFSESALAHHLSAATRGIDGLPAPGSWGQRWALYKQHFDACGLTTAFESRFLALRTRLGAFVSTDRFQRAVALSSPQAASLLDRMSSMPSPHRPSATKRLELLAMRYLQRFCMKCETMAFCGPVATGRIAPTRAIVEDSCDLSSYRPATFVSDRLLAAIADLLRREPVVLRDLLVRRPSGLALLGDGTVLHVGSGLHALAPAEYQVLEKVTNWVRVREICGTGHLDEARSLIDRGLLVDELQGAWYHSGPLEFLGRYAARTPQASPLQTLLERLADVQRRWLGMTPPQMQAAMEQVEDALSVCSVPRSHARGFYADRLPIVEEGFCDRVSLTLDPAWAAPFLRDADAFILQSTRKADSVLHAIRTRVSRATALARSRQVTLPDLLSQVQQLREEELSACGDETPMWEGGDSPIVLSPDLMIAASDTQTLRDGGGEWVLAESHRSVGCAGFFTRAMSDPRDWTRGISAFVTKHLGTGGFIGLASRPVNKTGHGEPLDCSYLENGMFAAPGCAVVSADDLVVDQEFRLRHKDQGSGVTILPDSSTQKGPLALFQLPWSLSPREGAGERRRTGRVVHRRASYLLTGPDLPGSGASPLEAFCWAQELKARERLPRWIFFVHPGSEQKPICIDFYNPFLCEELLRHLRSEPVVFAEEMYPSPDSAWLQGPAGRHVNEIRMLYVRGRAPHAA